MPSTFNASAPLADGFPPGEPLLDAGLGLPAAANSGVVFASRLSPNRALLWQIAACSVPPMALLAFTWLGAAGICFFVVFLLLLSYRVVRKDPKGMMCLVIGCMPILMLLRNALSYSSVETLLAITMLTWFVHDPTEVKRVFSERLVLFFFIFVVLYWIVSFALTGDYSSNLRAFELFFTAVGIRLLGKYRSYLGTAFIGLTISTFAMGLSFARFGDRLGMAKIDGEKMGNPISFGIPMALIFVLSIADGGRWLMLQNRTAWRFAINVGAGVLLLLSTSRGSWSVVVVCLVILLVGQRGRGKLLAYTAGISVVLAIWLYYADPATVDKYIFKTFESSGYWSAETNARVAQWTAFPNAFFDSPVWGFGPGSGKSISLQYTGLKLIWHALYLHIAIECGLIGITLLGAFLLGIVIRSIKYARSTRELAPLLGIVSYMVEASTIPAIDGASGLFLGCGLLCLETSNFFVARISKRNEPLELPASTPELLEPPVHVETQIY